ncbi:hypothetical protein N1031_17495 [Herbiconiux moechotypicola]|uniref:Uncharacterized protein n=1 Tax=Herbiconiux moechotypicola TaxID=637393 RepID=A0ABN3E2U9_9MICO|nr:hypothetical protein [Herbiconiux moechotypicola]MCS5731558.1 hypothetical protein [Herbiconiux moechotypicola]
MPEELERRTVLTAAAWSVPVVALAVATPLAAASTTIPLALSYGLISPSTDYRSGYRYGLSATVTNDDLVNTFTGSFDVVMTLAPNPTDFWITAAPPSFTTTSGGTWTIASGISTITFTFTGTLAPGASASAAFTAPTIVSFTAASGYLPATIATTGNIVGTGVSGSDSHDYPFTT